MSNFQRILGLLKQLHTSYPNYNMARHVSTALDEYGNFWGLSDKELLFALEKYKAELEMDYPHKDEELDDIVKDGMDLDNILKEENGEEY
jgi:hypothetical protein